MYVCMYVRTFMFAETLCICIIVLEKTRQILVERRTVSVIATGHELAILCAQ